MYETGITNIQFYRSSYDLVTRLLQDFVSVFVTQQPRNFYTHRLRNLLCSLLWFLQ